MSTVVRGNYEWDAAKAETNWKKHGVTFDEATSALEDIQGVVLEDLLHHDRTITLGYSNKTRILYVITTERNERIRLISARKATSHERRLYHA